MGQNILIAAGVKTATNNSGDVVRTTEQAAHFVINVTAVPGVDTVTPKIQGKDALGNYYDILVGTAIVATGITVLKAGAGIGQLANLAAADVLPDIYRVLMTHSAASNFNYTVCSNTAIN